MLDTATKKRIDDCRDILVGKLPDPKAQIEQITIALIYKFMDDMDKEAIDLGGKAKFFTDYKIPNPEFPKDRKKDIVVPFAQYSWDNLQSAKVTAVEKLRLYSEAIQGMDKNPNIPQLFRDIFKNAYLPYRDPETLKLFLNTIGEFEYTHSEKLGDAFEYLLSVMGSQGDAGQFRTPRHIIDFLVAIVDPQKNETILDPACGTAGFLISAFKYLMNGGGSRRDASSCVSTPVTPDQRKKIIQNFVGYDISPDMVRLSLVNLYLHGFSDPHIWEYDTLTSEDRWNESFDVILANPPFMSPKGGIRPHKKFSISSNRSEVLFVDYIAEHLNPKGRAGIIVPEGIIFQSGTAYKDLRKMLVENYLYAVVSLPAGVFNPYSGVKTSILLMDKQLAKQSHDILFVKIENDGYSLGAQRTPVKGGQLEEAIALLQQYRDGQLTENTLAHAVAKTEIAKNGDYNLSGERYVINEALINTSYQLVQVDDICDLVRGSSPRPQGDPLYYGGHVPRLMISDITRDGMYTTPKTDFLTEEGAKKSRPMKKGDVVMAVSGNPGLATILSVDACIHDGFVGFRNLDKRLIPEFFYFVLTHQKEVNSALSIGAVFKNLNTDQIRLFQIPLPPLSIQEEIVAEIEGYQKIIDGAKAVVENYKPRIDIDPEWEMVELGEVCEITSSKRIFQEEYVPDGIPFYRTKEIVELNKGEDISLELFISKERYNEIKNKFDVPKKGEILLSAVGTIGISWVISDNREFYFKDGNLVWLKNIQNALPEYIKMALDHAFINELSKMTFGAAYKALTIVKLKEMKIPLPPLETQQQIVAQIEKEQALVNASKELIILFEQKIKDRIAKVWGAGKELVQYKENEQMTMAAEG